MPAGSSAFLCTPGRDRTGTSSHSSVFETDASTNSATGANGTQRYEKLFIPERFYKCPDRIVFKTAKTPLLFLYYKLTALQYCSAGIQQPYQINSAACNIFQTN